MNKNTLVSIVMTYYNRKNLLIKTLDTIQKYNDKESCEVVIVDDASSDEHKLDNIPNLFNLNIKTIRINPEDKKHKNPCVPYNIGFKNCSGDIVIIQNPECAHLGDVLAASRTITDDDYFVYTCYSLSKERTEDFLLDKFSKTFNNRTAHYNGDDAFYAHPVYRSNPYHFCSAITKKNLIDLNGFDERYADGNSYDDDEFVARIKRKGLSIKWIEDPMVVHQWHPSFNDSVTKSNSDLYFNVTLRETGWRVN